MSETNVKGTINNEIEEAEEMNESVEETTVAEEKVSERAVEEMNKTQKETTSETMAETAAKKVTPVSEVEEDGMYIEEWNKNLPEITGQERNLVIANASDEFAINMQLTRKSGNMRSLGIKIFLSNLKTDVPYIDNEECLTVKKEAIVNSNTDKVMSILDEFSIPITIDTKKMAHRRAKEYLSKTKVATDTERSMNIKDACREVVEYAIEKAEKGEDTFVKLVKKQNKEKKKEQILEEQLKNGQNKENEEKYEEKQVSIFYYDKERQNVGIHVKYFEEVLEELALGYKPIQLCKSIALEEARTGKEILISNRTGSGYAYNMTGNERYYMFNIKNVLG